MKPRNLYSCAAQAFIVKTETIFYSIGIIFALATILYFTWEYLFDLSRVLKVIIPVLLTLFFWFLASYLRERDL